MDPRKYWTACRVHDWHYDMSDDDEVYRMGKEQEQHLKSLAEADARLWHIYQDWEDYHHNCGPRPKEPMLED